MSEKVSKREQARLNRKRIHDQLALEVAADRAVVLHESIYEGLEPIHPHFDSVPADIQITSERAADLLSRVEERRERSNTFRQTGDLN
jgi:hypothetical protein